MEWEIVIGESVTLYIWPYIIYIINSIFSKFFYLHLKPVSSTCMQIYIYIYIKDISKHKAIDQKNIYYSELLHFWCYFYIFCLKFNFSNLHVKGYRARWL